MELDAFTRKLVVRASGLLQSRPWPARLDALNELYDQLRDDGDDLAYIADIFPRFVAALIDSLAEQEITCEAQAQIYANSADANHRQIAGQWLKDHRAP